MDKKRQKHKVRGERVIAKGITKALLIALGAGAVIGIACILPATGMLYKEFKKKQWEDLRKRGILSATIKRLERQSLVSWREVNGEEQLILTESGKKKTLRFTLDKLEIKKPKQWDRLWRLILFDIPENKRLAREILRRKLKDLECIQLQKSVFVSRYECKDEIDFLRHTLEVAPFVHYVVAKEIAGLEKE